MGARNNILAAVLEELGWSPARLAREVNTVFGSEMVGYSTAWDWVHRSRVPRDPLPTVVAHVVSEAARRPLSVGWLWNGRARESVVWIPSSAGLTDFGHNGGMVAIVNDWLRHGGDDDVNRRKFLAVSGAGLTMPAWEYVDTPSPSSMGIGRKGGQQITEPILEIVQEQVRRLKDLDERVGGSEQNLRFIHRQFLYVADLVRNAEPDSRMLPRLMAVWARLCHHAGFAAYDGRKDGLAQRYWRTGLHAAHAAGDRDMGAYILADLGYQAADRGELHDSIQLTNAAVDAGAGSPPAVRSFVLARTSFAHAVIGDERGYRHAAEEARGLLYLPGAVAERPEWLDYYDEHGLARHLSKGLVRLAFSTARSPGRFAEEAAALRKGHDGPATPRESALQGTWLARSLVRGDELDHAIEVGRGSLDKLRTVRSPRVDAQLRKFDEDLAKLPGLAGSRRVSEFRSDMKEAMRAA